MTQRHGIQRCVHPGFDIMTPIQFIYGKCISCLALSISNIIKPALEFMNSSLSHELRAIGSTFLCWRTWWRRLEWHSFPLGDAAKYLTISHWMLQGSIHYFTNCTLINCFGHCVHISGGKSKMQRTQVQPPVSISARSCSKTGRVQEKVGCNPRFKSLRQSYLLSHQILQGFNKFSL